MTPLLLAASAVLLASSPAPRTTAAPSEDSLPPVVLAVTHLGLDVSVDFARRWLDGTTTLELRNTGSTPLRDARFILGRLLTVTRVVQDDVPVRFTQDVVAYTDQPFHQVQALRVELRAPLAPGSNTTLRIDAAGTIVGLTEVGYLYVRDRVDSAYTLLREDAHAWPMPGVPSDSLNRRGSRGLFTSSVRARVPLGHVAASAGRLAAVDTAAGQVTWRYENHARAPFAFLAIAPFEVRRTATATIFHLPEDAAGAHGLAEAMDRARAMLVGWYGPPSSNEPLTVIEIPEGWGSQASATGGIILQASAFRDRAQRRELYHELVHLWNPPDREVPSPRWNEGLSSFLEWLLAERVDSLATRAASQDRSVQGLARRLTTVPALRTTPAARFGDARLTDQAYTLGRVMFAVLHGVVGDEAFHRIYRRYRDVSADGGSADDLARVAREVGGASAGRVIDDWLLTTRWTELVATDGTVSRIVAGYR